jgi:two-component system chemotaxis response regulator CheY
MPDKEITIMSVDDFSTMRRIIKTLLKQLGYTNVIEADDGTTAWETLQTSSVDFIISDWNMPKMTGLDLLRKCRSDDRFKKTPFLMVTAEAEKDNIVQAVKSGVSNYIVKPFTADTLKEKIEKIFGSA